MELPERKGKGGVPLDGWNGMSGGQGHDIPLDGVFERVGQSRVRGGVSAQARVMLRLKQETRVMGGERKSGQANGQGPLSSSTSLHFWTCSSSKAFALIMDFLLLSHLSLTVPPSQFCPLTD